MRAAGALALLLCAPAVAAADWDAQVSTRLQLGGGAQIPERGPDPWPMFELGLRGDVLLGEARPGRVRLGPALDVRTEDFQTLELGAGAALLLPTAQGFGVTLTGGAGWGARPAVEGVGRDGAFAFGQIAFGWRPYNYFGAYAWTAGVYAATRVQLESDPRAWEITVGVEVDLELLFVIPVMFIVEATRGGDPDEPPR